MDNYTVSTASVCPTRRLILPGHYSHDGAWIERPKWDVITRISRYFNGDVDWYRNRYGRRRGERKFFLDYQPDDVSYQHGNMLMGNGASALWQFALGNGTTSANSALGSGPTYYNNAQTYIYVGDGGITAGSGTVSVTNGSASLTFSGSQSGLQGKYIVVTGDSSAGIYEIVSGSGTGWTMGSNYGGSTAGTASWSTLTAETHSQTALVGTTNTASQIMDATFPANATNANFNVITGATNATPIVLSFTSGDISTNDIVQVFQVRGNTGANGMFVANPASSTSATLLGSVGTGSYAYEGIVTRRTVIKFQATYGPTTANFEWNEWAIFNGTGSNKIMLNRKVFRGGTKTTGSVSLQAAIGIG